MGGNFEGWRYLRMMRHRPPGRARAGARRNTFTAALEQSEQLFSAASFVNPSASPLLLFYGLTQGAQALMSARQDVSNWQASYSHGLKLPKPDLKHDRIPRLDDLFIRDEGEGFFQQVASVLDSPTLGVGTSMASLACSLPQGREFLIESSNRCPLRISSSAENFLFPQDEISLVISPAPYALLPTEGHLIPTVEAVESWLAGFPRLKALGRPFEVKIWPSFLLQGSSGLLTRWKIGRKLTGSEKRDLIYSTMDSPPVGYPGSGIEGFAYPVVGENERALHPLVAWWATLFGFSMLARYHPRSWVGLIDPDRSVESVPVEAVLSEAAGSVPALILRELEGIKGL